MTTPPWTRTQIDGRPVETCTLTYGTLPAVLDSLEAQGTPADLPLDDIINGIPFRAGGILAVLGDTLYRAPDTGLLLGRLPTRTVGAP